MEEVILRFPHLGEKIFKILSNKNVVKCNLTSRSWHIFITNEKFYKKRVFYENLQKDVDHGNTPLHIAARKDDLQQCKLIIENVENKNPNDSRFKVVCVCNFTLLAR